MESLKELYRSGVGPSSSHTMGPAAIALTIKENYPECDFVVDLYGSLSLTGKGHMTDAIMIKRFAPRPCRVNFLNESLPFHPNGMIVHVYPGGTLEGEKPVPQDAASVADIEAYSVGGGKVLFKGDLLPEPEDRYPLDSMTEILTYCRGKGISLYDYVKACDEPDIEEFLRGRLSEMFACVEEGLQREGRIQGALRLKRVAGDVYQQALNTHNPMERDRIFLSSYAYAVAEQNADGGEIVTAPTCGASGVVPAVLYYANKQLGIDEEALVRALAIGGLFGNIVKTRATISGADGGCQAEVGTACAMASAAMAYLLELNNDLIAYAAEMGLEHNLGLTCDPVGGYVQIPCIERNAYAALRAVDSAILAKQLGYLRRNKVSFDTVVDVMRETGKDLNAAYKETSLGGLAKGYRFEEER